MIGAVPEHMNLIDVAGSSSLTFACGDLPADAAVIAAGHEPNGYFWEGVAQYIAAGLLSQVELDCEAGMFCARGGLSFRSRGGGFALSPGGAVQTGHAVPG